MQGTSEKKAQEKVKMKGNCKGSKIFVKKVLFYDETNLGGGIELVGRVGG
jgi:hypothetical protein